ncbi:t-SNARE [Mycena rosella]|uniref:t-SNARE n=1 Tax=Mycena rosella TaxID=1033263 RepID=A0AAD7CN61_MYCRO|nr:t-SNARE [Mycena rosella]
MATDRMAAYRAQRQGGQQADGPSHELTTLDANGNGAGESLDGMPAFLAEASSVQDAIAAFNASITRISALNTRSLDALTDDGHAPPHEIHGGAADLPAGRTGVPREVTAARRAAVSDSETRRNAGEITEVISGGGDQVFMQALTTSPRYAQSRSAYQEVQARAQDLKKMEQTLGELAQLFSDMATLVEQQDETVVAIEDTAIDVEKNAAEGLEQTTIAVRFARAARKKRYICLCITLVVAAILASCSLLFSRKKLGGCAGLRCGCGCVYVWSWGISGVGVSRTTRTRHGHYAFSDRTLYL